ncbi:ATP-binding protein [Hellea balneolensis]|uniref:ATP-binding protein n=1 Tax=Hellea balneolensis TaxID=287478 RepID=UPI0004240EE8|nr:ATP-binding protein [Hellea balneolensis]
MKLTFQTEHISIKQLADTELPTLTVMTGLNGAGKTHLLQAIDNGSITVQGSTPAQVKYYNLLNFRMKSPKALNAQQLAAQTLAGWQILTGVSGNPKVNWLRTMHQYFSKVFGATDIKTAYPDDDGFLEHSFWHKYEGEDEEFLSRKKQYESLVRHHLFENLNFKKNGYHQSISRALKKCQKPIHLIVESEFREHFSPHSSGNDYLSASLSVVFTKYKVKQFLWAHRQWGAGGVSLPIESFYQKFEEENLQPWVVINEIMEGIHQQGGGQDVFNFEITNPQTDVLTLESYQGYIFQPQLLDKVHGQARAFEALSSGEQTLLALALSIYQSADNFELPKVLLLDEIDASLHPSMTKALLGTLESVFVARGIEVILATHSPSTIALASEETIYVVNKGNVATKISKHSRAQAMSLISEGYITLDQGISLFKEMSGHDTCIITEGHNTNIIQQVLNLSGISNVQVLDGLESITCCNKMRALFDFLSELPHEQKVIFVWDCDYKKSFVNTDTTFGFRIPDNKSNKIVTRGIENAFPESVFEGFTVKITKNVDGTETHFEEFNKNKKGEFAQAMASNTDISNFSSFAGLIEIITEIQSD